MSTTSSSSKKKIVIVSTSASHLQGHPTGTWMEEFAAPYYLWKEAGHDVFLASVQGGPIPIDANSLAPGMFTEPAKRFLHDPQGVGALSHSVPISDIDWSTVDVIFLPGGHGTCVDFINNPTLQTAIETVYANGKIVAAVCHGPIALCDCRRPSDDGSTPLVAGKIVTGFSDAEEDAVQLQHLVPYLLESKLKELGGQYEKEGLWQSKVCVDGNLITGQNPQSSEAVAKAVLDLLAAP